MPSTDARSTREVIVVIDTRTLPEQPVRGGTGGITKVVHHQSFETSGHLVGLSVATHQPGAACDEHDHRGADEQFFVLSGLGIITVHGVRHHVRPGDSVFVPAGVMHIAAAVPEADEPFVVQCLLVVAPDHEGDRTPWVSTAA